MSRWEPNARGRLGHAALELFSEWGFEQTTAAEIAHRAGLTERTFFRHYVDKREVLFDGSSELQALMVAAVAGAPGSVAALDAVGAGLAAAGTVFDRSRRDQARRRQAVIAATADLQERELIKLASLATALADVLRSRGVADPAATLAAETGIAVFKVAFARWVAETEQGEFALLVRESLDELRVVLSNG